MICSWWWCLLCSCIGLAGAYSDGTRPETCPITTLGGLGASTTTCSSTSRPNENDGWKKGDVCQKLGSTEICSFTNPSFNGGLGLSLVTTTERLKEVSSLPAVARSATKRAWGQATRSYHEEDIPGKGLGLVASRRIAAGELILARPPAVLVDDHGFENLAKGRVQSLLVQAIEQLPPHHRMQYLNLTTHAGVESHEEKVYQIFAKNNFRTRVTSTTDFYATFVDGLAPFCISAGRATLLTLCCAVSRLNHGCRPSCGYQFDRATLSQKVFAARDILPGEELTVTYIE